MRLHKTVVMIGMMGAGKSAVGKAVAQRLGVPFRDSDAEIERAAQRAVPEIFARDGEAFFRDREHEVIARLLEAEPAILSTGGGAWLAPRNRARVAARGVSLWIRADLDLLWARVRHKDTRPLLRTGDPRATLARLLAERTPVYEMADLVVDADAAYAIDDMAGRTIEILRGRPDVLERI